MKKLIALVLALVCVSGLVGCNGNQEPSEAPQTNDFEFSFKVIEGSFSHGERVGLSVDLTNGTSESYVWEGSQSHFRARVKLICMDGNTEHVISPEPIPDTDDMSRHEVMAGETRSFDFYFTIPVDAVSGKYSLVCSFENSTQTFDNVFELKGNDNAGDMPTEDILTDVATPNLNILTLKDLVERNGENLTWADFASYYSEDVGSGLYILRYPVGMDYSLLIGGGSTEEPPMYIRLLSEYDAEKYIDVRTDSIDDFVNNAPKTADFSYEEVLKTYKENEPGVKYSGFKNTSRVAIERIDDVIEQAKNECTIKYDTVDISYDSTAYIWAITFSTGTPGGCQTVYMDCYGVTCLVVYGE